MSMDEVFNVSASVVITVEAEDEIAAMRKFLDRMEEMGLRLNTGASIHANKLNRSVTDGG